MPRLAPVMRRVFMVRSFRANERGTCVAGFSAGSPVVGLLQAPLGQFRDLF